MKIEWLKINELKAWANTPRLNEHAVPAVSKSIELFGFNAPILCDKDYNVIAGHTRLKAAKELRLKTVPVICLELNKRQREAFAIADNKTAEIADWDSTQLAILLRELEKKFELGDLGFSQQELHSLLEKISWDENEIPFVSKKTKSKSGDFMTLGDHRVGCINSASTCATEFLDTIEPVQLVFAGPPCFNQRGLGEWNDYDEYTKDMRRIMSNCTERLSDGGIFVWHVGNDSASRHDLAGHHSRLLESAGLQYLDSIAWTKTTANYGSPRNIQIKKNRHYYPAIQWEMLLVYQKPGKMPRMTREGMKYMSEHHSNVWEIPTVVRQFERFGHPAVCPVEIPYRCM